MKISARNIIKGSVRKINKGVLNAEVVLEIAGGVEIVSQITVGSVKALKLKKGMTAYAVIKADNIIIGIDD
jgi:molybdate transport system regulatory protein